MVAPKEVRLRTRARDAAGNLSKWATSRRTATYRNIHRGNSKLTGTWKTVKAKGRAYGDDLFVARKRGSTITFTANARSISLIGRKGPRSGMISLTDGTEQVLISVRADKRSDLEVLYTWGWTDVARRTVTVTARPSKPFRPIVALDAWVVIR